MPDIMAKLRLMVTNTSLLTNAATTFSNVPAKPKRPDGKKAIEPGEPCDLCRVDFVPIYRKLGREQFLKFIQENPDVYSVKKAKERLKQWQPKPND